jgi:hypothetical protein
MENLVFWEYEDLAKALLIARRRINIIIFITLKTFVKHFF